MAPRQSTVAVYCDFRIQRNPGAIKREREADSIGDMRAPGNSRGGGKKPAPRLENWICDLTADSDGESQQGRKAVKWATLAREESAPPTVID